MKKHRTLFILGLLLALPVFGQPHRHQMNRPDSARGMMMQGPMMMQMMPRMMGMMQGGMMMQMMQNPLHHATMMAFVLPAMTDTLGLSTQQQQQLHELKQRMMQQHHARQQEMRQHHQALQALFKENQYPEPAAVRAHLQAMARLKVEDQVAPYETFRQMMQVLNETQRTRLHELMPRQMMHYMMRLPMMEIMQMMHMMHGREGMMHMMGGGMRGPMGMMQMMQEGMPMHRPQGQDGHRHNPR